ncbi:MAG: hypothetical protein E7385_04915 [Ruminococcaceae bacterium]|nr:hypothetical protein [Oscillospiraceae bacterium]
MRSTSPLKYDTRGAEDIYVSVERPKETNPVLYEIKKKKEDKKTKKHVIVLMVVLFMLGLTVAFRFASITQINYTNHELEKQYTELESQIKITKADLEGAMSISEISRIASEKLNMHKPLTYQITYINVNIEDQTEIADVVLTQTIDTRTWYEKLFDNIKLFFGIV